MPTGLWDMTLLHKPEDLTVLGNAVQNRIVTTGAAETLNGQGGKDSLEGDDLLIGGDGHDYLAGGGCKTPPTRSRAHG